MGFDGSAFVVAKIIIVGREKWKRRRSMRRRMCVGVGCDGDDEKKGKSSGLMA